MIVDQHLPAYTIVNSIQHARRYDWKGIARDPCIVLNVMLTHRLVIRQLLVRYRSTLDHPRCSTEY